MLKPLENKFEKVNLINLSMGALERVGVHSNVINMLKALGFQQHEVAYLIKEIIICCIRRAYYAFYMRSGIRHGISLLFFPGDVPPVTLRVLDTMPYSS